MWQVKKRIDLSLQVALITSMLPACSRGCSLAPEQLQDSTPEQAQDSITVATVDSYQVCSQLHGTLKQTSGSITT